MLVPEITHRRHGGGGPENSPFRASSVGLSDRTAGVCELQRWPHDLRAGGASHVGDSGEQTGGRTRPRRRAPQGAAGPQDARVREEEYACRPNYLSYSLKQAFFLPFCKAASYTVKIPQIFTLQVAELFEML